jgi:8-oxo-dGTP diphosphatase
MIRVAVGIIFQQKTSQEPLRVLLCQRKHSARYGLKWEFPGGKVEEGESTETCLRRELREELNIHAEIGSLFHRQQYVYPDSGTFDVFYYLVPSFTGEIVNHVFESYTWAGINAMHEYDILEGNKDIVAKLVREHESILSEKN